MRIEKGLPSGNARACAVPSGAPDTEQNHDPSHDQSRAMNIDMSRVRRVLIIKMSAMGDVIHALPVASALKEAYPHLEVSWVVEDAFAPLLRGNPDLDNIFRLPKMSGHALHSASAWRDYTRRMNVLRREKFDLTLDLQGLTKSAAVAAWSRAPVRLGYHWLREFAPLLEKAVPQRADSVHIVDQYLDVARYLGVGVQNVRFPMTVAPDDDAHVVSLLREADIDPDAPFIVINPASAQRIKEWGTARYGALLNAIKSELGLPAVLVTADIKAAQCVQASAQSPVASLAGRTSLLQLCAVLRRCAAHVCGDTGSGHIAAAFGRPVVSIIGPTNPDRSCPYNQRDTTLSHREHCGTGCDFHKCQFDAPRCMEAVTVAEVIAALRCCLSAR